MAPRTRVRLTAALKKRQLNEKWALITVWCELSTFALPSILYLSHELVAVSTRYNALFVMSHKPVSSIPTDCNERLRVTREEAAGLTQLYFNIVHTLCVQRGRPAVLCRHYKSCFSEGDDCLLLEVGHIYDADMTGNCSFERRDVFMFAGLITPPRLLLYFSQESLLGYESQLDNSVIPSTAFCFCFKSVPAAFPAGLVSLYQYWHGQWTQLAFGYRNTSRASVEPLFHIR